MTTDDFEALGIPFPENVSTPSHGALQDTLGVHLQGIRLGDILLTVCSCEQWTDQAYNIKTRTDRIPGNEWLGYDATNPPADDPTTPATAASPPARPTGTGTARCAASTTPVADHAIQPLSARARSTTPPAGTTRPVASSAAACRPSPSRPT